MRRPGTLRWNAQWARVASAVGLAVVLAPNLADARQRRPAFEPDDLDMTTPGLLDLDLQVGMVRDGEAWRVVAPDVEINLGLTDHLELGIDGTFSLASPSNTVLRPKDPMLDNLWLSLKHALVFEQDDGGRSWALGLQHGPRLPMQDGMAGIGYQAVLLGGFGIHGSSVVFSLGAFVDPRPEAQRWPPWGVLSGVDVKVPLDAAARFSLTGGISGAWYFRNPGELAATPGITWAPSESLEMSISAVAGYLAGGAAYGFLVGFAPKWRLWVERAGARAVGIH